MSTQAEKAARLRALHHQDEPLILVNAWDAITARIVENLGFPAVATTSAGVANACGYADGESATREIMLAAVATIARVVAVPLTADMEAGYGADVESAVATANGIIDAGAVGLNIEDERRDGEAAAFIETTIQETRIAAIRDTGAMRGVPLVVNARTDVYWHGSGDEATRLDTAIERGRRYLAAGADCIFIPGLVEPRSIERAVRELGGPLNILAMPTTPPLRELRRMRVARLSYGSAPMAYAAAAFRELATAIQTTGDTALIAKRIPYDELNALFKER